VVSEKIKSLCKCVRGMRTNEKMSDCMCTNMIYNMGTPQTIVKRVSHNDDGLEGGCGLENTKGKLFRCVYYL